jgi:hypothetical protein
MSNYQRSKKFIDMSITIWGHKLSQEFKSSSNVNKLYSEWANDTDELSDFQFKTSVSACRHQLINFPTIAEFLKFAPDKSSENSVTLTQPEVNMIKEQITNLEQKRSEIFLQTNSIAYSDLNKQEKLYRLSQVYTLMRAIDDQLGQLEIKLS